MLGLVRVLEPGNDAVLAAVRAEGLLLDTRLLKQRVADNNTLRQLRQGLDDDLDNLRVTLDAELASLRRISAKRISKLVERDPMRAKHIMQGSAPTSTPPSAPTAEKVVDFWKGKQDASSQELLSIEAQLGLVRSKIEDVKTATGDTGDNNGPAKLMCMIGALRQKLQEARARTNDYQKLLAGIEEIALPRSSHAAGAMAALADRRGPTGRVQSDYDQEALSLCHVETSLINELESARRLAEVAQLRKASVESKIKFFSGCLEDGNLSIPEPPEPEVWPVDIGYIAPVSTEHFLTTVAKERALESDRTHVIRERRVTMLREMTASTMDKWIEKQRFVRLSEHTERHVDRASQEKASILFHIDEVAAHAKVSASVMATHLGSRSAPF